MNADQLRFATTRWSLVLAAGQGGSVASREALERLCTSYWYPVFAFVRRRGHSIEEAEDLTQSFFGRLIEKGDLAAADRDRGRFRTFLLTACQHFLLNQRDRSLAARRGGGQTMIPIDIAAAEERYQRSLGHAETPELLYDRQWSLALLASVLDTLREEYAAAGKAGLFDALRGFLTSDDDAARRAEVASALDMSSGALKVAVHRLRRRYREALRSRIAETVDTEEAIDDEMRYLLKAVSGV